MSDTLQIFTGVWQQLTHSPLWIIIGAMTLAVGLTLKSVKLFQNRFIPLITLPFATFFYWKLGNPGDVDPHQSEPRTILAFYGFLVGFGAWAFHRAILKRLEKYCPWFPVEDFETDPPFPDATGSNVNPDPKARIVCPPSLAEVDGKKP